MNVSTYGYILITVGCFFVISDGYPGVWSADMCFYRVRRVFVLVVIVVFAHKKTAGINRRQRDKKQKGD
ncbi:hypothetical protein ABN09_02620 [Morganella morganii]|nr:hypothetical protein ABN09_02620 [Morganella morganii]